MEGKRKRQNVVNKFQYNESILRMTTSTVCLTNTSATVYQYVQYLHKLG